MLISVGCLGIYIYQLDDSVSDNKGDNVELDIQDDIVEKPVIHKTKTKSIRRKSNGISRRRF
jgi:hypothetical protein